MQIVEPRVELLSITPDPESVIERAARTCYKSEGLIAPGSAGKLIRKLIARGHEAMIEHAYASFLWVCDRGVSHELVRHRLCAFAQESTRYCNYGKAGEIAVIQPPGLPLGDEQDWWTKACLTAEKAYMELLASGTPPQIARSVLPTCLKTEIVITANLREWRHIFAMRCAAAAHPQIRQLADATLAILTEKAPNVFPIEMNNEDRG